MENNGIQRGRGRGFRGRGKGRGSLGCNNQSKPGNLNTNESKGDLYCGAEEKLGNKKLKENQSRLTDDGLYCNADEKLKDPVSNDVIQNDTNRTYNRENSPNNTNSLNHSENNKSGYNSSEVDDSKNIAPLNDKSRDRNEGREPRRQSEYNNQRNNSRRPQNSRTFERTRGTNFDAERADRNNRVNGNWRNCDNSRGDEKSGSFSRGRRSENARNRNHFPERELGQDNAANNRWDQNNLIRRGRENTNDERHKNSEEIDGQINDRNGQGRRGRHKGNDRGYYNTRNYNRKQFPTVPENKGQECFQSDCNDEVQSKNSVEKELENDEKSEGFQKGFNINAKEFVPGQTIDIAENTSVNTLQDSSLGGSDQNSNEQELSDESWNTTPDYLKQTSEETTSDAFNNEDKNNSWNTTPEYLKQASEKSTYDTFNTEIKNDSWDTTPEYLQQTSEEPTDNAWNYENKPPSQLASTKTSRLSGSVLDKPSCKGETDRSWETRTIPQSGKTTRSSLPESGRQPREQTYFNKGRKSMGDSPFGSRSWDKDFEEYDKTYRFKWKKDEDYKVVKEMQQDLFLMGVDYALAHCVAEDLNMGSGIAVSFRQNFKKVDELMKQNQKQGGLAVLHIDDGRYIYYLITKQKSSGKPTLETMFRSVKKLRDHMVENKVGKLAIPRLGCGLDRLEWTEVKNMLEFLFMNTEIEIVVCNFQQAAEVMQQKNEEHYRRKCKIERYEKPIIEAEKYTLIIYLAFEDGYVSPQIEGLEKKFNIMREYKASKKSLGSCIEQFQMNKDYLLYGCIVQKDKKDEIHFDHLTTCLKEINKKNKKFAKNSENYVYVALQTYTCKEDSVLMDKIINLARNTLHDITLCIYPE